MVTNANDPAYSTIPATDGSAGLTKREAMATAILPGLIYANPYRAKGPPDFDKIAGEAVTLADALIDALNRIPAP